MTDDYLAGNTRLRARRAQLLGPAELDRLAGLPADRVLAELAGTGYGPAIERARAAAAATGGATGGATGDAAGEVLEAAVTGRLRESLTAVAGIYPGVAGEVVGVLLQRWDLRDARTLLRGVSAGVPAEQVTAAVVGAGRMRADLAAEVAAGPDLPTALERLAAAGLPGPESSWSLRAIGHDYELHQDLAELDRAVTAAAVTGWRQVLARGGRPAGAVAGLVTAELDAANLLAALRLRTAAEQAEAAIGAGTAERHLLPCGSIPVPVLAEVVAGRADPARVAPRAWSPAVERWQRTGDLPALAAELADAVRRTVLAGWLSDPFGAGVPVAYVTAVEAEARRLLALPEADAGRRSGPLEAA